MSTSLAQKQVIFEMRKRLLEEYVQKTVCPKDVLAVIWHSFL